jgi:hypothetical protein
MDQTETGRQLFRYVLHIDIVVCGVGMEWRHVLTKFIYDPG